MHTELRTVEHPSANLANEVFIACVASLLNVGRQHHQRTDKQGKRVDLAHYPAFTAAWHYRVHHNMEACIICAWSNWKQTDDVASTLAKSTMIQCAIDHTAVRPTLRQALKIIHGFDGLYVLQLRAALLPVTAPRSASYAGRHIILS